MENNIKQVIIIRKDLKMRRGKEVSQGAHSSLAFITNRIKDNPNTLAKDLFTPEEQEWIQGKFKKICLQVDSEEELLDVYQKAKDTGLTTYLITDAGMTEFGGVPTNTCVAIGPHESTEIDEICSGLKLY